MQRLIGSGSGECPAEDLELVGDDLMKWRFKIRSFDDSSEGAHRPPHASGVPLSLLATPSWDAA